MPITRGVHFPKANDAFSPLFQLFPLVLNIFQNPWKIFPIFTFSKKIRFYPPIFLLFWKKNFNFPPIFYNFPIFFVRFMCFFTQFTCFLLPPTLTMMHLCSIQYTYAPAYDKGGESQNKVLIMASILTCL